MLTADQLRVLQHATAEKPIAIIESADVWRKEAVRSLTPLVGEQSLIVLPNIQTLANHPDAFSGALIGAISLGVIAEEVNTFSNGKKFPVVVTTTVNGVKIEPGTIMPQGTHFAFQEGRSRDWPVTAAALLAGLLQKED